MVEDVSPAVVRIVTSDGASGSGFIIDSVGRALTNAHVVQGFSTLEVRLVNGQSYTGRVLGVDEVADLAVLQIESLRVFEAVKLGDSDLVSIGDDVIAMGFPLGDILEGDSATITKGIISAKRVSESGVELLQTDAAINPGNSGGPLFARGGEVVGVNTSKVFEAEDGRSVEGIGLAVSINYVKDSLDALARGESVVSITPTPVLTPQSQGGPGWFSLDRAELRGDEDGLIETLTALDNVRNFAIVAEFEVPYDATVGGWDVGFLFRNSGDGNLLYVAVLHDGSFLYRVRRDGEETTINVGEVGTWNQSVGAVNELLLYVVEDRGWLFVNSEYVTDLDVSGGSRQGTLEVATEVLLENEVTGYSTSISSVGAFELSVLYGPQDGSLTKDPGLISIQEAGVDVEWGYASVEFRVPDKVDTWSGGFLFRETDEDDFLAFRVESEGSWIVSRVPRSADEWETLEEGSSAWITVAQPVVNRLEIFFIGSIAILYVNDQLLGTADIGSVLTSGDVEFGYGFYQDDDLSTARFEDFTVWGLEGF